MSDQDPGNLEDQITSNEEEIETIEVAINLKDATVASEGEVHSLQAAQQHCRNKIHVLRNSLDQLKQPSGESTSSETDLSS
jgi:hypothetical protein